MMDSVALEGSPGGGADLVGTEAALHSKNRAAFYRSTMTFSDPQGEKHAQVGASADVGRLGRETRLFVPAQRCNMVNPGANWYY